MTDKDRIIDGILYRRVSIHSGVAFSFNKKLKGHYIFPSDMYNFFMKNDIELYDDVSDSRIDKVDKFSDDIMRADEYKGCWTYYHYYVTCDDNTFAKLKLML